MPHSPFENQPLFNNEADPRPLYTYGMKLSKLVLCSSRFIYENNPMLTHRLMLNNFLLHFSKSPGLRDVFNTAALITLLHLADSDRVSL